MASPLSSEDQEYVSQFREAVGSEVSAMLADNDCMRFVRARKKNIKKAAQMATSWAEWWKTPFEEESVKEFSPSTILKLQTEDPKEDMYTELCPHAMFGFSKVGHPVYWEKTGEISNILNVLKTKATVGELVARHVRFQEMARSRMFYINNKLSKTNTSEEIEKAVIVFDLKGLGMSPDLFGINYVKDMFTCDGNYYPERLHKMIMINAPWYFSAIWALVSFVVDPVTAEKIVILRSNYEETLKELIDEENIPKEMGGLADVQWHWPYPEGSGCSPTELQQFIEHMDKMDATDAGKSS